MSTKKHIQKNITANPFGWNLLVTLLLVLLVQITGCASEKVEDEGFISSYQEELVKKGPQQRDSDKGIGSLLPSPEPGVLKLNVTRRSVPAPDQSFRTRSIAGCSVAGD